MCLCKRACMRLYVFAIVDQGGASRPYKLTKEITKAALAADPGKPVLHCITDCQSLFIVCCYVCACARVCALAYNTMEGPSIGAVPSNRCQSCLVVVWGTRIHVSLRLYSGHLANHVRWDVAMQVLSIIAADITCQATARRGWATSQQVLLALASDEPAQFLQEHVVQAVYDRLESRSAVGWLGLNECLA